MSRDEQTLNLDAHYRVDGYPGVAWYLLGYVVERDADYDWTGIETENLDLLRAVMVGDDRVFEIDRCDLIAIDEDAYCGVCGQLGCSHDGR